jgi:hypothetical protein
MSCGFLEEISHVAVWMPYRNFGGERNYYALEFKEF